MPDLLVVARDLHRQRVGHDVLDHEADRHHTTAARNASC
jgi:hypothetical protein